MKSSLFSPQFKFPGQFITDMQTSAEYYDASTGLNATAQGISMNQRANQVVMMNLGRFNRKTPDGEPGVNNILLVTNGDDDRAAGFCFVSVAQSELLVTTFTGFGPANGFSAVR